MKWLISTVGNERNPAIVFVHGFPFSRAMWQKQMSALKDDYYCISYDIRGLGEADVESGQYTIDLYVDDLIDLMDEIGVKNAALCGLSMGGYIALQAIDRVPDRFTKLILCDTRADSDDNTAIMKRAANIIKINEEGTDKFVEDFLALCVGADFRNTHQEEYKNIVASCKKSSAIGMKGAQVAMLGRSDKTESLSRIAVPTLVICGENDTFTAPALMQELAAKIRGAEFRVIPKAGHLSPVENSTEVNKALLEFLRK